MGASAFDGSASGQQLPAITVQRRISISRATLRTAGLAGLGFLALTGCLRAGPPGVVTHRGMANASAVVAVGEGQFLAASDEDNTLRLYHTRTNAGPDATFDATPWLGLTGKADEADFEGAARIGDMIYWIGSHGRNKDGKNRPNRQRLLATRLAVTNGTVELTPVGSAYTSLIHDLVHAPQLARFNLRTAAKLSPEQDGGLNLEGLAATPEGGLLLAFRSPAPEGKALLVPVLNPAELTGGKGAKLGEPIELDLGGLGVRDIVWSGREYFLIGGRTTQGGRQQLFRWAGPGSVPTVVDHPGFKAFNPEAIAVFGSATQPRLLVLSDDGNQKQSQQPEKRKFRSFWIEP